MIPVSEVLERPNSFIAPPSNYLKSQGGMHVALALEAHSLTKDFGTVRAVDGIDLSIEEGQIFGLLGPNGSGKSTFMRMMLGLVKPTSGRILVMGMDPQQDPVGVRRAVGYVPEAPRLYDFLTAREYLDFVAEMYGVRQEEKVERIESFLAAFELTGREDEMLSGYSQGMRQKVAIIGALLHKPKLLVLDEPLNGLDPRSAKIVKDLLNKLTEEGVTTIFSTHVLEIAQAICDRIAIMYRGTVLHSGTFEDLKAASGMPGSNLEEVFLKMTGTDDVRGIVEELAK